MPWNDQGGGGPWGGGDGPWGSRGSPGGGKNAPGGSGGPGGRGGGPNFTPPDFEALWERLKASWRSWFPRGAGAAPLAAAIAGCLLLLWLATGIYTVLPDEQGVVLRFGAYAYTTQNGLHYHLPAPIESVLRPKVTSVRRTDIGFNADPEGANAEVPEESLMLTGDENIVDVNLSVFWTVKDAREYLFDIRNPDATVKSAAESAIRDIVGHTPIAPVLAEGRAVIEGDTQKLLQSILDSYGAGILVTEVQLQKADPPGPVIEAFRDVQRARTDQERLRNEAEAYSNDVVPRARGDALRLVQQGEAYRQEIVARANGDAQRFTQVYRAWAAAKDVTSERLYLETMEDVLKNTNKIVLDRGAAGGGAGGAAVPYLPLDQLLHARPQGDAAAPAPPPIDANASMPASAPAAAAAGPSTGAADAPLAPDAQPAAPGTAGGGP